MGTGNNIEHFILNLHTRNLFNEKIEDIQSGTNTSNFKQLIPK